jgi:HAMP domain-containing protein
MLSLAEARVRTTNSVDAQALTLLNAVRVRSIPGRPEVPATATTPAIPAIPDGSYAAASLTPATMLDAILLERRIEFLGEGIRNIDLMRLNATIPAKGTVSAIPSTAANYVWPIPSTELSTNNLMSRN